MHKLRVMSWNVHETLCPSGNGRFSLSPSIDSSDIVFLQEAPANIESALGEFRYSERWMLEPSVNFKDKKMGLVVCSRYPLSNAKRVLFEDPGWVYDDGSRVFKTHPKGALIVDVKLPDIVIRVACVHLLPTHLFNFPDSSKEAIGYLEGSINSILEFDHDIDLIAGDFNNPNRKEYVLKRGYQSISSGVSTRDSGLSHDDILFGGRLEVGGVSILPSSSDHYLVSADVIYRG